MITIEQLRSLKPGDNIWLIYLGLSHSRKHFTSKDFVKLEYKEDHTYVVTKIEVPNKKFVAFSIGDEVFLNPKELGNNYLKNLFLEKEDAVYYWNLVIQNSIDFLTSEAEKNINKLKKYLL